MRVRRLCVIVWATGLLCVPRPSAATTIDYKTVATHRREVHRPTPKPTVPDVAQLPRQPRDAADGS